MKKHDVFISYKSEDAEMASWVRTVLETNGVSCWMAPADIPGGSSYAVEIPLAIQSCRVLVLVLSGKAQDSKWIPRELDTAINAGKTIMPFMVENIPLKDDFNFYLSNVQRYSAYESKTKAVGKMLAEIQAVLHTDVTKLILPDDNAGGKPKPARKFPVWGWIALAAVILGLGALLLPRLLGGSAVPPKETVAQAEPTAAPTPEPAYHIRLTAPDTMNVKDFGKARAILRERLDIFTDGRDYDEQEENDTIDLLLPVSAFAGQPVEKVLRSYLSRAVNFSFYDLKTRTAIPLERQDIASVELKEGVIPGIDAKQYGVDTETYQYIEFRVSEGFAAAHGAEMSEWKQTVLAQDTDQSGFYYYTVFPAGDGRAWYLLNNDLGGRFSELVAYNLQNDPLPQAFYFLVDLNTQIDWQDPAAAQVKGKNLCLPEEIAEASVTFTLRAGELTGGQKFDTETVLKARLDSIGVPYAFGSMPGQDGLYYGVRIDMAHMGLPAMGLLAQNYTLAVRAGMNTFEFYPRYCELIPGEGAGFTLRFREDYYDRNNAAKTLAALADVARKGDGMLYIGTEKSPLFALPADDLDGGAMRISMLCEVVDGRLTARPLEEKDLWLRDLTAAVLRDGTLPSSLYQGDYLLNPGPDGRLPDAAQLGVRWHFDQQALQDQAGAVWPGSTAFSKVDDFGSATIYVSLDLPVDDSLAQRGPELARKLYEALDFEHVWADQLVIYLIDENNEAKERARIIFSKATKGIYSADEEATPGYIYAYGILRNGRVEGLGAKMKEVIEGMEFYQNLTHEYTSWDM